MRYKEVAVKLEKPRRRFPALQFGLAPAACLLCASLTFAQANNPSESTKPSDSQAAAGDSAQPAEPPSPHEQPNAQDEKKEGKSSGPLTTKLRIRVTNSNDKPVSNASVYVRFYTSGGFLHHEKLAEMNFKTNLDGSVKVPEIPQGKILIQVIATGWHTYGKWYDIDKDEASIPIKLEPPPHWY